MKRKMNDLWNGKIAYAPKIPTFSADRLDGIVPAGERFGVRFFAKAAEGSILQGFLYSTNVRVKVQPAMFEGAKIDFRLTLDSKGLQEDDSVEGAVIFCTTEGEYHVPYRFMMESGNRQEQPQPLHMTPEEFAAQAQADYAGAYVRFVSREFAVLVKDWGGNYGALYEGICTQSLSYQSMEQFLIGAGLKLPVSLKAQTDKVCFKGIVQSVKEEILLTKDTWGFAGIRVSSDADFLTVERPEITTEEFVGSSYSLGYYIHKEKLHAGRNLARLTITCGCETICCTVEVRKEQEPQRHALRRAGKQGLAELARIYIDYCAGRKEKSVWIEESLCKIAQCRGTGDERIFFDFYETFLLYEKEAWEAADRKLSLLSERREELEIPEWKGCYLYLSTLQNTERSYLEYVREEVAQLFTQNRENWILQWLLFRLSPHLLKNDTEKLDAIRRQYLGGCHSIVMYLEAWEILKNEPLQLRRLGDFEVQLLHFLCRHDLLDREICGQTAQLAMRVQSFDRLLFEILCSGQEKYPTKNMLTAICTMLIKGHRTEARYEKWYELGILEDVRLTGLYEYYIETIPNLGDRMLPESVRRYFGYHNTMDYVRKAAVYANIIRNRSRDAQTWQLYRYEMERFMEEQLAACRINHDLALIYETLLTKEMLSDQLIEGLSKLMFVGEVSCSLPHMRHVVVIHEQLRQEQRVPLAEGRAYVHLYSPNCSILLEDEEGRRFADPSLYRYERLLTRPLFEEYCRERPEHAAGFILHDCCSEGTEVGITQENARRFVLLCGLPEIRESYRRKLERLLLEYYYEHPQTEALEEFLNGLQEETLVGTHRKELIELLAGAGLAGRALALIYAYGAEHVRPGVLVQIASREVQEQEFERSDQLLALCEQCFAQHVYDENILRYLIQYFEGSLMQMKELWRAARGFDLQTYSLEERILTLLLYLGGHACVKVSGDGTVQSYGMEDTEAIFVSYAKQQGKARLCRGYLILKSHEYFVLGRSMEEETAEQLAYYVSAGNGVPTVCRLALLRWYSEKHSCSAGELMWRDRLFEAAAEAGQIFAFYRKLPMKLLRRYQLQDKFILEYRTNPKDLVTLYYRINDGEEKRLPLRDSFAGIFSGAFTMFYHDRLTWHFVVETKEGKKETAEQTFLHEKRPAKGACSRYDLINRLIEAQEKHDSESWNEIRRQYIGQQYLVDELFKLS
ncbi:MAG: DUF5717 family protein [Eubacteriales bacterium]|nr:DUF5717 family protein [Eubacteriales bacterium]